MDTSSTRRPHGIPASKVRIETVFPKDLKCNTSQDKVLSTNTIKKSVQSLKPVTHGDESIRSHMENIRKVVTMNDEECSIIGHKDIQSAILSAFLLSNTLGNPLDPSITCNNILLAGLGGLGKTELMKSMAVRAAKWIKADISVFNVKCSDLHSKYIGDGEKAINCLFDTVEKHAPSLLIFDEADGLMKSRSKDETDASRRFKTELLAELRGGRVLEHVVIVAATNKAEDLDENFLSRFPLKFVVRPPRPEERKLLFEKFLSLFEKCMTVDWASIDLDALQEKTSGYSGNDIRSVIAVAARNSLRTEYDGKLFKPEELIEIKHILGENTKRLQSKLLPMSMDAILHALKKIPPSIHAGDAKNLNKWAQKYCGWQELKEEPEIEKNRKPKYSTNKTCQIL